MMGKATAREAFAFPYVWRPSHYQGPTGTWLLHASRALRAPATMQGKIEDIAENGM